MSDLTTIDEILDFAIDSEQKAVDLYSALAEKAKGPGMKEILKQYTDEERGHKAKLLDIKTGKQFYKSADKKVLDMKISDYTVDEDLAPDSDYQAILLFAMKREKAAYRLYRDLAGQTDLPALKNLLLHLAQEEANHKLHFEIEYDDNFLAEN